ncbi:MAG: PspC domain-containing protein [Chlamydiae bacterium]|nr:PspC domain-containing protein [Chlamydiota bacterium]
MKRFYRNQFDKKFLGVLGGIALVFKMDSNFLRLLFVLISATPLFPIMAAIYLVLAVVMPEGGRIMIENPGNRLRLGKFFRIDSTLVRLIFIVVAFTTFFLPIIVTYIAGAILVPEGD